MITPKERKQLEGRILGKTRGKKGGHLIWTSTMRNGVPMVWFDGRPENARRLLIALQRGYIEIGERVVSSCGEKRCIEPSHLRCEFKTHIGPGGQGPRRIVFDEAVYIADTQRGR